MTWEDEFIAMIVTAEPSAEIVVKDPGLIVLFQQKAKEYGREDISFIAAAPEKSL